MTTLIYATQTCSRCGGSGEFSWNRRTVSTCFGCWGTGEELTQEGLAAKAAVEDWKDTHWGVRYEDVEVGDAVWVEPRYGANRRSWMTVVESTAARPMLSGGVEVACWTLRWESRGERYGSTAAVGTVVRVRPESYEPMYDFARTLSGVTVAA